MTAKKAQAQELASLMFAMGRFMREHMEKKMKAADCPSLLHLETLRYVREKDRPHMRDLAKKFNVTPPAATLLVDGLAKAGLLRRIVDPKDRRSVRIALTPMGKRMIDKGVKARMKEVTRLFSILNTEEQLQLAAILKKFLKNNNGK